MIDKLQSACSPQESRISSEIRSF